MALMGLDRVKNQAGARRTGLAGTVARRHGPDPSNAAEREDTVRASLTDRLWGSIDDIFKAILDHPFIEGLTTGSLDRGVFRFYVVQDVALETRSRWPLMTHRGARSIPSPRHCSSR